jgi:serine/threonine protein kinase
MPHVEMPGVNHKASSNAYLKQGRASDVWSLGCILYRLVYHHPPFGNMQLMVKLVAITNPNHNIPFPPPPMGEEFLQVIPVLQGCLVFEPKKRLTIQQLLEHDFLKGGGSISSPCTISIEVISRILKRGIELNVNSTNTDRVTNVGHFLLFLFSFTINATFLFR